MSPEMQDNQSSRTFRKRRILLGACSAFAAGFLAMEVYSIVVIFVLGSTIFGAAYADAVFCFLVLPAMLLGSVYGMHDVTRSRLVLSPQSIIMQTGVSRISILTSDICEVHYGGSDARSAVPGKVTVASATSTMTVNLSSYDEDDQEAIISKIREATDRCFQHGWREFYNERKKQIVNRQQKLRGYVVGTFSMFGLTAFMLFGYFAIGDGKCLLLAIMLFPLCFFFLYVTWLENTRTKIHK